MRFESPQQPTQLQQSQHNRICWGRTGKRGSSSALAAASTAAAEPAATALILTFLSDGDGGQSKVLLVVLRTLEPWLSQGPSDDGLVFQASADCLSQSPIMMASRMRAGGRGICASSSEASQSIHAQIIIPFVFPEHAVNRASTPKS